MKSRDFLSGAFLLVLSALLFSQTKGLTLWGDLGPAEGFFPFILSLLLAFLSLVMMIKGWLRAKTKEERVNIFGPKRGKLFLYFASFLLFGLIFKTVGYSMTLAAYFIFILIVLEKKTWRLTVAMTGVSIVASYILFIVFLGVSLPEGILSGLLQKIGY